MSEQTTEEVKNPEAVLAELRRAQDDLKTLREQVKQLTEAKEAAETALSEDKFRGRALEAETKVFLQAQGLKDADRLIKYVGTDGLDFDDNGAVVGLEDRMKQLKTDLPELFDAKRRVGGQADVHANGEVKVNPLRQQIHAALNG